MNQIKVFKQTKKDVQSSEMFAAFWTMQGTKIWIILSWHHYNIFYFILKFKLKLKINFCYYSWYNARKRNLVNSTEQLNICIAENFHRIYNIKSNSYCTQNQSFYYENQK